MLGDVDVDVEVCGNVVMRADVREWEIPVMPLR